MNSDIKNKQLLDLCASGDLEEIKVLVQDGADPRWQDNDGLNTLMVASKHGHLSVVEWLLDEGVPWNALQKKGYCAGDFALDAGHSEIVKRLLNAGCRAEMVLGAIQRKEQCQTPDDEFLGGNVSFAEDGKCILDHKGEAVVMDWEQPLMEAHAQALHVTDGDILNVGFGLGLIDAAIQKRKPRSHTIIEAHPQIYTFMLEKGWNRLPGVRIIHSKWQDVIGSLPEYDGIFFDTYGEHYSDLQAFHQCLPKMMKPEGIYSFFNGLAPDNRFFHLVYCEIVKAELKSLGFNIQFVSLPLNVRNEATWKAIKHRYWWSDVYHLPVAQLTSTSQTNAR